jgi:hypothetical protein
MAPGSARTHGPGAKLWTAAFLLGLVGLVVVSVVVSAVNIRGDPGYGYGVVNDSDNPVIVDVREQLHRTWIIAPHSYGGLFGNSSLPDPAWRITIVDDRCVALQTWPIDIAHNLLYVGPTGTGQLTTGATWEAGLRTARSVDRGLRTPPCT